MSSLLTLHTWPDKVQKRQTLSRFKTGIQPVVKEVLRTSERGTQATCCCCQSLVGNMRSCSILPCPCLAISTRHWVLHRREEWAIFRVPHSFSPPHKQTGHTGGHPSRDPIASAARQPCCNKTSRSCEVIELQLGLT